MGAILVLISLVSCLSDCSPTVINLQCLGNQCFMYFAHFFIVSDKRVIWFPLLHFYQMWKTFSYIFKWIISRCLSAIVFRIHQIHLKEWCHRFILKHQYLHYSRGHIHGEFNLSMNIFTCQLEKHFKLTFNLNS